jgi:hypothetical protein
MMRCLTVLYDAFGLIALYADFILSYFMPLISTDLELAGFFRDCLTLEVLFFPKKISKSENPLC